MNTSTTLNSHFKLLPMVALLCACTTPQFEKTVGSSHDQIADRTSNANAALRQYPEASKVVVPTQAPRFTSHSMPLDRSEILPAHIASITLRVPGRHNIKTVAALIERAIDIPVVVSPDATMAPALFLPVGITLPPETVATNNNDRAIAEGIYKMGGSKLNMDLNPNHNDMELNYAGSLAGLLNQVAQRADVRWSFESGRISFYRVVTRNIAVKTLPGGLQQSASLSLSSSGGGSTSASTSSDSNVLLGLEKTLASMISANGKLSIDPNTGGVTVRDAYRNVEAIDQYIQSINQNLMRQVSLTVEVLQVNLNNEFQSGIDWNLVSNSMRLGRVQLTGAPNVTTSDAASIGFLLPSDSGASNQLFLRALERFGRVSSSYSTVVTTVNRQAVPVGNLTTQSYLKQVIPTVLSPSSGNTAAVYGAPSLVPGEITTGFTLNLLPILLDSNHVLVQCNLSLSSLKSLKTFTSGTGQAQQSIQQPNVSNFGILQRMMAKSNQTIVLSGFDTEVSNSEQSDVLLEKIPGSRRGIKDRTTTVVLITPRILEY